MKESSKPGALSGYVLNSFMGTRKDGSPLRIACKSPERRQDKPKPTERPEPTAEKPTKLGLSCDDVSPNFDDDDLPF